MKSAGEKPDRCCEHSAFQIEDSNTTLSALCSIKKSFTLSVRLNPNH